MNRSQGSFRLIGALFPALLVAAFMIGCGGGGGGGDDDDDNGGGGGGGGGGGSTDPGPAGAAPDLGVAATYGVFASSAAVVLAADALVVGDVGLNPAGDCDNCVVGVTVNGVIHNGDAAAIAAQTAFGAAYIDAAGRSANACPIVDGELSSAQANCSGFTPGPVYRPGLYRTANPIGIGAGFNITLDAQGNADAVFIFQTDTSITTGTDSEIILAGGALARNVFWVAGSAATLGVSSTFKGTVIANGAAVQVLGGTVGDRTLVEGRLFSSAASVGVDEFATVTVPQ